MGRGVTQEELARAVGISVPTYRRLERGEVRNPKFGQLVNCAIALVVALDTLIEDEWREWLPFDARPRRRRRRRRGRSGAAARTGTNGA